MKAFTKKIVLENGREFYGYGFGADREAINEIVFNTSMVGYQEIMSDPSYTDQMVVMTYPLIGNYGMADEDYETKTPTIGGMIVREYNDSPSNFRYTKTLNEVFEEHDIPAIWGVDTRALTRIIRESGVMNGALTTEYKSADAVRADAALMEKIKAYTVKDAVDSVTTKCMETFNENGKYHVALFDFGYKRNILRNLVKRGCKVTLVPGRTTAAELAALEVDGVMLSNGPGDPAENVKIIENLKEIAALGRPVFGICLGHQLMALATGAKTEKLKYGHRGVNQPVTDFAKDRTFITSQNHGYAVVAGTVDPAVAEVSHVNANDGTTEGIRYKNIPCFTVQFHPEACGGPHDTAYLFDKFISLMEENKKCR